MPVQRRLPFPVVLSVGWLVLAVLVAMLVTTHVTFTLTRLDRLHARVDAAQAALDAQLVRRAAALRHVAEFGGSGVPVELRRHYEALARAALASSGDDRQDAENALGRAVTELAASPVPPPPDDAAELLEAAARVRLARRFYNDAVRDTRALRARRLPRLMRMAGRRALPEFFDIDDTVPLPTRPAAATTPSTGPSTAPAHTPPLPKDLP